MLTPQPDLFTPVRGAVVADGDVCGPDYPVETLSAKVPGCRYGRAQIELAQHHDGRWMWGIDYRTTWSGGGYHVGPKWGRFADCRVDAVREALAELADRVPASVLDALRAAA